MSFWTDFKDQFKQEYHHTPYCSKLIDSTRYNKNGQLKESVDTIKQTAERVGQTSSKITNKAKGTLGSVSDKIKEAVPYTPDSTKLKKGAGKISIISNCLCICCAFVVHLLCVCT